MLEYLSPDQINFCFELGGASLVLLNIRRVLIDKVVHGVSLWPTAFWTVWGFWNLIFYTKLQQPWSFAGGVLLVFGNGTWLTLALIYRKNKLKQKRNEENDHLVVEERV
jgi:hypothetical protein